MTYDEPNDKDGAMEELGDAPASVRAAVLGKSGSLPMEGNMMDSLSETQGPLEDGSQVLMMAARAPTKQEDAKEQGPMPKPASKESIWGRRSAGGAREPGQRTSDSNIDKKELMWNYIGSGMIARTFPNAEKLILTTGRGPRINEINYGGSRCEHWQNHV